jgi:hypothetical protein
MAVNLLALRASRFHPQEGYLYSFLLGDKQTYNYLMMGYINKRSFLKFMPSVICSLLKNPESGQATSKGRVKKCKCHDLSDFNLLKLHTNMCT